MKKAESTTKLKVLLIWPWPSLWAMGEGSGVREGWEFLNGILKKGHSLTAIAPSHSSLNINGLPGKLRVSQVPWKEVRFGGGKIISHLWRPVSYLSFQFAYLARAIPVVLKEKPDLVIGVSSYAAPVAFIVSWFSRVPAVIKLHGVFYRRRDWPLPYDFLRNFEEFIAVGLPFRKIFIVEDGTQARELVHRVGTGTSRVSYLLNGTSLEWMKTPGLARNLRNEFGLEDDAVLFIAVSRLVRWKRIDRLIRAARRVIEKSSRPVYFLVFGEGEERGRLEDLISSLGVEKHVRLPGVLKQDEVEGCLRGSDVFVSVNDFTNGGVSTREAMICGLPVVAGNAGHTASIVIDGETGFLVDADDMNELAGKFVLLAGNVDLRLRMGEKGKEFARMGFNSWEERVESEVREILEATGTVSEATTEQEEAFADEISAISV